MLKLNSVRNEDEKMQNAVIIKGTILDPMHILLLEPLLDDLKGEVEIVIRMVKEQNQITSKNLFQFIQSLPPGKKTKNDIDKLILEERNSW